MDNRLVQDGVIRQLLAIGEASNRLMRQCPGFTAAHPEVAFRSAYDTRNVLVHLYTDIDLEVVWRIVQKELPTLHAQMQAVLDGLQEMIFADLPPRRSPRRRRRPFAPPARPRAEERARCSTRPPSPPCAPPATPKSSPPASSPATSPRTRPPTASPPRSTRPASRAAAPPPAASTCTPARPGLLRVNAAHVDRINLHRRVAHLATLPDATVVAAGDMVATIKVIPFAVPGAALRTRRSRRPRRARLRAAPVPPAAHRAGAHRAAGPEGKRHRGHHRGDRGARHRASAARCCRRCAARTPRRRSPRRCNNCWPPGRELLLVAGASATVDRRDVGPAGVVRAGGEITPFRHARRSRQPDLPRPHRRGARAGAARLRPLAARQRHRLRPAPPLRRPAGRAGRGHAHGRRRPAEGHRRPPAAARQSRGQAGTGAAAEGRSPPWCWRPANPRAWRPTTSCWSPTAAANR